MHRTRGWETNAWGRNNKIKVATHYYFLLLLLRLPVLLQLLLPLTRYLFCVNYRNFIFARKLPKLFRN